MKKNLLLMSLCFIGSFVFGQSDRHVNFSYQDDAKIFGLASSSDGNYFISGSLKPTGSKKDNAFVAKISRSGDVFWTKIYGDTTKTDIFYDVFATDDNGFIVTGKSQTYSSRNKEDVIIVKFNDQGDQEWLTSISLGDYATANSVFQTQDNGYFLCGNVYVNNDYQALTMKLNVSGDTTWTNIFGGIVYDYATDGIEKTGGGYYVTGRTQSYGSGNYDALLMEISSTGKVSWYKTYGGSNFDEGVQLCQYGASNDIFIVGSTSSKGPSGRNLYLIKADQTGTKQWDYAFGGSLDDYGQSIMISSDNHIVASGWSSSFLSGESKFYMVKTNLMGIEVWQKVSGTSSSTADQAYQLLENNDLEYVMAGINKISPTKNQGYLIFADSSGCSLRDPSFSISGISQPGKFCENATVTLTATMDYSKYNWSNGEKTKSATISMTGDYFLEATDIFSCSATSDVVKLTRFDLPVIAITPPGTLYYCPGTFDSVELTATAGYPKYMWDDDIALSQPVLWANTLGKHVVEVSDTNNCSNTAEVEIKEYAPFENEEICVVTVDTITNKNLIAWERTKNQRTSHYNVYKESSTAGSYILIGSVDFNDVSVFVDLTSNPLESSQRYKITSVDSCGTESTMSPFHQTLHLQVNQGVGNQINLDWQDKYLGFNYSTYNIYRGVTPGSLALYNQISSNLTSWTDINPPSGPVFYQVAAVMTDTCNPSSLRAQTTGGPFSQSISNIKDYQISGSDYLEISPSIINIYYDEDTNVVTVFASNTSWSTSTDESWIKTIDKANQGYFQVITETNNGTGVRSGQVEITQTGGKKAYLYVSQYDAVGIPESQKTSSILVYPNPFKDFVYINCNNIESSKVNVILYSVLGEVLVDREENISYSGSGEVYFDLSNLNLVNGVYVLRVNTGDQTHTIKLIKK